MSTPRMTPWVRLLGFLVALAGLLALAACGGGSGAPNNAFAPPPPPTPALVVAPAAVVAYAGTPATLTVTSGVAPFSVFTSDASALPVTQAVAGTSIVLVANQVEADTGVLLTVRDAVGQSVPVQVTVRPSPILNELAFTPSGTTCGTDLCSGQTGTATVTAKGSAGALLSGRQIRFDVIFGPIAFTTTNPATPTVQTLTISTDSSGVATAPLAAPADVSTQPAEIRATDVTTGQTQVARFTVVNSTSSAQSPITVIPSSANITGPFTNICSSGFRVDYYIYGGKPPYTVTNTFPTGAVLVNNIVDRSGGFFEAITNGTCVNPLVWTVTDSAGKQPAAQPTLINAPGSATPTPAPAFAVAPNSSTAQNCSGKTFTFVVTGGTAPYNAYVSNFAGSSAPTLSTNIIPSSGGTVLVTITSPEPVTGATTITFADSSTNTQTQTATINCTSNITPPPVIALSVLPSSTTATACGVGPTGSGTGKTFTFTVSGGTPGYRVTVANFPSPTAPNVNPATVSTSGGNFTVTMPTNAVPGSYTFTVTDSATSPASVNVSITCTAAPAGVVVTPPTATASACQNGTTGSGTGKTFTFVVTGGTPSYTALVSSFPSPNPPIITGNPITTSGGSFTITMPTTAIPGTYTFTVVDSIAPPNTALVTITCNP